MYGQLYHRTISQELPEPQRDPRGRVRRGGWRGADGRRRLHGWAGLGWRGAGARLARVGAQAVPASAHRWARCVGVGSTRAAGRVRSTAHPDRNGRRSGWLGAVDTMRAAKRDACKTAAMNAGRWQGARMRQAGQARAAGRKARSAMPRAACRCRRAQSPFRRTACRYRGKAGRRWQHLRAMRDFGLLDAKKGPWRQDSRAMYPESPDCARKRMHRARMLPS